MYSASRPSLEPEADSDCSVDPGIVCLLSTKRVESVDRAARYLTNFGVQLEEQKVHGQVGKDVRAGQILCNRLGYRGVECRNRGYSARGDVRPDVSGRFILVLTRADG